MIYLVTIRLFVSILFLDNSSLRGYTLFIDAW